jgi:hypothetical protein
MSVQTEPDHQDTDTGSGERTATVGYDECFDLLSNHRRRCTLHYLHSNDGVATIQELSEQIAAWENGKPIEEVSHRERKRVYTSLQQVHLPRLDEAAVVTFDHQHGVVEVGPAAADLDIYLEVVERRDVPWSVFYLGLTLLNLLVFSASVLGLSPLVGVPGVGVAVFVVTTYLVAALAHVYVTRSEMRLGAGEKPL